MLKMAHHQLIYGNKQDLSGEHGRWSGLGGLTERREAGMPFREKAATGLTSDLDTPARRRSMRRARPGPSCGGLWPTG